MSRTGGGGSVLRAEPRADILRGELATRFSGQLLQLPPNLLARSTFRCVHVYTDEETERERDVYVHIYIYMVTPPIDPHFTIKFCPPTLTTNQKPAALMKAQHTNRNMWGDVIQLLYAYINGSSRIPDLFGLGFQISRFFGRSFQMSRLNLERWKSGNLKIWKSGNLETLKSGHLEISKAGNLDI